MASNNNPTDEQDQDQNTGREKVVFVLPEEFPDAVKAFVEAGKVSFPSTTLAIDAAKSPNGKRLETAYFPIKLSGDLSEDEAYDIATVIVGGKARATARMIASYETARRQQAKLDLEDANRGPEWAFIKQARAYVKMEADGNKIPKKLRGLSEGAIAQVLYEEANEE